MAIGFRREYTPSTIDFSYLDPNIPDFKSTPKVGETSQAPAMSQSGSNDSGMSMQQQYIPPIPPMAPIQVPDSYDFENTVYNPNTGQFQAHTYPKIPTLLGTEAVENTMMYGRPSGSDHLNSGQINSIQDNALATQANILETTQNMPVGSTTQEIFDMANLQATGFDSQGNYYPEYDPAVAAHAAHMAAIPTYGAHSSSSAGGNMINAITNGINMGGPDTSATNIGFDPFAGVDANTMMCINNPAEGYQPSPFIEANQHLLTHGPVDTGFLPSSGSEESSGGGSNMSIQDSSGGATGGGKGG